MQKKTKWIFIVAFFISAVAVAFLSASLATDYWVEAKPTRQVDDGTEGGAINVTDGDPGTKFNGYIHFGLFHGHKSLDHGLGLREGEIWIQCNHSENLCGWVWSTSTSAQRQAEIAATIQAFRQAKTGTVIINNRIVNEQFEEHGLFDFGLWVCSIVFVALSIIWGLISMGFAVLNASTRPIETITGPMGLYLWNSLASAFSLLAVILYVVLYYEYLKENVLSLDERLDYWTTKDRASLHYSFYFVVVSTVLYASNLLVVACGGVQCKTVKYGRNMNEKAMDGVMMY